jgi:hypothetical protein
MLVADYPEDLIELGYFDDDDIFFSDDPAGKRVRAFEALEEPLSQRYVGRDLSRERSRGSENRQESRANGLTS